VYTGPGTRHVFSHLKMIIKNTTQSNDSNHANESEGWIFGKYLLEIVILLHLIGISFAIYKMCQSITFGDDAKGINRTELFKMRKMKRRLRDLITG
jgi:hypothetical protein